MFIATVVGAVKTWVISVYVVVLRPSLNEYDLAPATEFHDNLLLGVMAKLVAVPSLTYILNNIIFPWIAALNGTESRERSFAPVFVSVNCVA